MKKIVKPNEVLPCFYGVAWFDDYGNRIVAYPVPLNILVRAARSFYNWLRYGFIAVQYNPRDAYAQGRRDAPSKEELLVAAQAALNSAEEYRSYGFTMTDNRLPVDLLAQLTRHMILPGVRK